MMGSLGDSDLGSKPAAKRLAVLMLVLLIAWVVVLAVLSRTRSLGPQAEYEQLPVYSGAYQIERKRAEVPDWEQVTYRVEMGYPSTAVYHFYRQVLESEGWRLRPADQVPEWKITGKGKNVQALFLAFWASPDELRMVELRLVAVPDEEPPTMQVVVQRSRAILPSVPHSGRR